MRRLTFLLLCLFIGIGVATAQTMKITGNVIMEVFTTDYYSIFYR